MLRHIFKDLVDNLEDLNGSVAEAQYYDFGVNDVSATTTNSAPTFQNHLSHSVRSGENLPAGDYRIGWSVQVSINNTNNDWVLNIEVNPGVIAITPTPPQEEQSDPASSQTNHRTGFRVISWGGGPMTIDVGFANRSSGTVTCKSSAVEVWKV